MAPSVDKVIGCAAALVALGLYSQWVFSMREMLKEKWLFAPQHPPSHRHLGFGLFYDRARNRFYARPLYALLAAPFGADEPGEFLRKLQPRR